MWIHTDVDSVHDVVTDGIEKSLVTDSKPESESDLKPKSETKPEPEVDQMKKLVLNPEAKEFVPSYKKKNNQSLSSEDFATAKKKLSGDEDNKKDANFRRRGNNYNQGRKVRLTGRASKAQREDSIRRTVYVSDIDQSVTEEVLAGLFSSYGQVVDCRICGDPHSVLRFAFVEFSDDHGARAALSVGGTMIGYYPVRVLPSKTAILPVNPTFLPRSEDEREMCSRTIYCTNVDKNATEDDVKIFFESACGEVTRIRLLGDQLHSTRIAFVEFAMAESAVGALNCSGVVLGSQPIRVSPSKTPVRPRFNTADGEKFAKKMGPEIMNELAEGYESICQRALPSTAHDALVDAYDTNLIIECEPEYLMPHFGSNPDIDEKPPMPLRDCLEKEAIDEAMKQAPLMKDIVDHYSGPDRVTAKTQNEELDRITTTLPQSAPDSVKRFADRVALSLKSNPEWRYDKKYQFMDKLVLEASQSYK
ncbi:hypothetical protein HID58_093896 [Brassica napus]|uniref:RRM domain-containing protein n=1 Tax=Brassica napus TaxID=3708 RepID=A0ABQ7X9L6_BRANA|nr:hypothetical protein HID58_093896 [Brassica napus]